MFLDAKRAAGLSERTLETYRYRLRIFCRFHPKALPDQASDLEQFVGAMGPTPETRETYYRLLRNLYNWLERRGVIKVSPMRAVEAPRVPRKIARSISANELIRLVRHPDHPPSVRAFLLLLADTGVRLSEALSIVSPRQFSDGFVTVNGKTGGRIVPVSSTVESEVSRALPWPWQSRGGASKAIVRAFHRAGITGKRASPHTLRHTFTRLWEGDESLLVGILGWTSSAMLKTYRPYDLSRAKHQHRRYSPTAGDSLHQLPFA